MTTEQIKYYDEASAARELRVSRRTMQRWRRDGGGPPYVRLGVRRVGYAVSGIDNWAGAHTYAHRAAELAKGTPT